MTLNNRLLVGSCLAMIACAVSAEDVNLRLCTASATGNYYASGQEIARQVERGGVAIELVETDGSMDNLERMAAGQCDAGIVQIDAYLVYQEAHKEERLDIRRPLHLYDEYTHLICRRDSGIESISDVAELSNEPSVLVGPQGSGGAISWGSFALLDSSYASVKTENIGGKAALDKLIEGEDSCLMYVSGLRSNFSATVDESGDLLKLVAVDDSDLGELEFLGLTVYTFHDIPAGTYSSLQAPSRDPVKTLTVRAIFIVNSAWADAHPGAFESLVNGVERATPLIKQRVSGVGPS